VRMRKDGSLHVHGQPCAIDTIRPNASMNDAGSQIDDDRE